VTIACACGARRALQLRSVAMVEQLPADGPSGQEIAA
jgi:hypothetical protein